MSVASRSFNEQYNPVRRRIKLIFTLYFSHLKKTDMVTAALLAVLCSFHVASGVIHTYQYFYTATSGIPDFAEFIVVGAVDGQQILHYDSITKRAVQKAEWVTAAVDSDFWNRNTGIFAGSEPAHINNIGVVKSRFNQTEGVHTFQMMYGCQWDDESEAIDGFSQYGFDGEDFLTLDLKNLRFIGSNPQAVISQNKWNNDRAFLESVKAYRTQICIDWLKKYLKYGSSTLGRTVSPEVTLLQKDSKVVCHSTGFYPDGVMITLKKDGVDMHEDLNMGETLPNEDGTFQKRAELTMSPEEKNGEFTCEVAHKSGEPIVKILIVEDGSNLVIIIGCVIAALVLIGVVVAIVMMKKKKDYKKAEQSDAGSDTSDPKGGAERVNL